MIGIVVVSHSRALAEAAVALATEMVAEDQRPVIAVAAGLDESTFGTDAAAVAEALSTADSPDGVLVLLDLGSAVLSAELALEFVDPELAGRVVLSSAPLVEGLVAAVVTASTGAALDVVAAEATRGLAAKQAHLVDSAPPSANDGAVPSTSSHSANDSTAPSASPPAADGGAPSASVAGSASGTRSLEVALSNEHGLHARPAARLVSLVQQFDARVTLFNLDNGRGPVDAGSLSMVATLNSRHRDRLEFTAAGPQAAEALAAIRALADDDFGDRPAATSPPSASRLASPDSRGTSGSGLDLAIGPAAVMTTAVDLSSYQPGDPATERQRAKQALTDAQSQLHDVRRTTLTRVGADEAAIFDAQLGLLDDAVLIDGVFRAVAQGRDAASAFRTAFDELAATFDALDDPYQRERAQDVRSVRDRVLRALTGAPAPEEPAPGSILVVPELDAATAAAVDVERLAGIAVRAAGTTGHGVIVARSRGIPLITGIGDVDVPPAALVAFDARHAEFHVDPDETDFRARIERRAAEREQAFTTADLPATTSDGRTVAVLVNVGSVEDARTARGADGSGLVRTEVLFGDRRTAPTPEEQLATFRELAAALAGRPVTIRTWDVGGDKPLPFLPHPPEPNPFLGERGLRLVRRHPGLLRDQLTAIRALAAETPTAVMFPMVTTAEEVAWALHHLDSLGPRPSALRVGIMVEVPAAALRIDTLARGLDFVSIGTNDLTQYTTAADRTNSPVAPLADALDPAVLRLVDHVVRHVPVGTHVAVCGDLASDPLAAPLLLGLGIHELSAVGPQIPLIKAQLRGTSTVEATTTAATALTLESAEAVRALVQHP